MGVILVAVLGIALNLAIVLYSMHTPGPPGPTVVRDCSGQEEHVRILFAGCMKSKRVINCVAAAKDIICKPIIVGLKAEQDIRFGG